MPFSSHPTPYPTGSVDLLPWIRFTFFIVLSLSLVACSHISASPRTGPAEGSIVEVNSGRQVSRTELLQAIRRADFVLLGEKHDNPNHHRARGALLRELGSSAVVVAEHLPRSAQLRLTPSDDLVGELSQAGFAVKQWQWPLHQVLFADIAQTNQRLLGGNISRELARQIAREGRSAMPIDLLALIDAAPLASQARSNLDADLIQGHCGQLPETRLEGMRWAQRARDAAMAQSLLQAKSQGAVPSVLVAGNGHVRLDYGVPQVLRAELGKPALLSIGFVEAGTPVTGTPYDYVWISAVSNRDDPCAGFTLPVAR